MDKHRKKSKALIITFFIVLVLLFLFYLLFIKNDPFTSTKGTTSENRGFFSLFSSSKEKKSDLDIDDENNVTDNINQNTIDGENQTGDGSQVIDGTIVDGNQNNEIDINTNNIPDAQYNPNLRPIPIPEDVDPQIETPTPNPNITVYPKPITDPVKQCNLDDYKLTFTDAEQEELDRLLREFYRIAASIKTEEDIDIEYGAKVSYVDMANEAKELTKQCYEETSSSKYLTNFDWNNSLYDIPAPIIDNRAVVYNYNRTNEARLERKNNPWFAPIDLKTMNPAYYGYILRSLDVADVPGVEFIKPFDYPYFEELFGIW